LLKTQDGDFTRTPTSSLLLKSLIPHGGSMRNLTDSKSVPMVTCNLTTDEIKEVIWRIGPNKAPGSDGLTAAILRKTYGSSRATSRIEKHI
jgi:hypothetical protein